MVRVLIVDGVEIPVAASHALTQEYEELEAKARRRFLDGGAWQRKTWSGKLRTTINGQGIAPPGLYDLDTDNPITLACIAARAVNSASNVIALPAARRVDAGSEPMGFAVVGDQLIGTPLGLVGDTATLTVVSGASGYQARYWPLLNVLADPIKESLNRGTGHGWTLTAEEL